MKSYRHLPLATGVILPIASNAQRPKSLLADQASEDDLARWRCGIRDTESRCRFAERSDHGLEVGELDGHDRTTDSSPVFDSSSE